MNTEKTSPHNELFRTAAAFAILCLAVALVYSNAVNAPFVVDDVMYISANPKIMSLKNLWPPSGTRYFAYLSFALNYRLGSLDPAGYHAVNIAVHALNASLVYLVMSRTLKTPRAVSLSPEARGKTPFIAALIPALLFAVHPIETGAVTYVAQRFASLAALFYLLSLYLFITWRAVHEARGRGGAVYYVMSLVFAVLAQKTKEISFTLPFVIVLYDVAFHGEKAGIKARLKYLAPFLATALIIPVSMLTVKYGNGTGIDSEIMLAQVSELKGLSRHDYLITQFRVIVTYMRLLVMPVNQSFRHDIRLYRSLFEPQPLISLAFIAAVIAFSAWLMRRALRTKGLYPFMFSAGVFWFFITLSVESSIVPIKDVIFEHRVYLPSIGAAVSASSAILLVAGVIRDRLNIKAETAASVLLIAAAVSLGIAAHMRNNVWKDRLAFYSDIVKKSPSLAIGHYDLGKLYRDMGRYGDAVGEYKAAIALDPGYYEAHDNLGNIYLAGGLADEAISEYMAALRIKPDDAEARYSLGNAYSARSMPEKAVAEYKEAIRLKPSYAEYHNNLGNAYLRLNRVEDAYNEFRTVLAIDPGHPTGLLNMGNIYYRSGRYADAAVYYGKAVMADPSNAGAEFNLGSAYLAAGRTDDAVGAFKKAIDLKPGYEDAHFRLGEAHARLRRLDEAAKEFRIALRLDPEDHAARLALADALMEAEDYSNAAEEYREFADFAPESYRADIERARRTLARLKRR